MASISSSQYAYNNPLETIKSNGLLTVKLCYIIHKHGWNTKLFNASSSEIYKGHVDYTVAEDDHNMYHSHPYSIAKTMGHNMVKFYRDTYSLPFYNGVIFTTESPLKKPHFLLNKVKTHIEECKTTDTIKPLIVGDLSSYINIRIFLQLDTMFGIIIIGAKLDLLSLLDSGSHLARERDRIN
jgi:GDP-D-mannose dehydratase